MYVWLKFRIVAENMETNSTLPFSFNIKVFLDPVPLCIDPRLIESEPTLSHPSVSIVTTSTVILTSGSSAVTINRTPRKSMIVDNLLTHWDLKTPYGVIYICPTLIQGILSFESLGTKFSAILNQDTWIFIQENVFVNVVSWMSVFCSCFNELAHLDVETKFHYGYSIMGAIASQITSLTIVYSDVYPDADQRKHQSSASLAFMRGIHRGPMNSPHKWPVTRKMFPFDDVIMQEHFIEW